MVAISGGRAVFPWQRGQDICDVRRSEDGDHDIYGHAKERARGAKMERVIVKRSQERHYFADGIDLFEHCA